ncbi:MAG: type II secretion system protein N [Thiotrichales bacterium]
MSFSVKAIALFLIALAISLVVTVPARWVLQYATLPAELSISAVTGTLWRGQADTVRWRNLPEVAVQWKLKPTSLLLGRLGINVTATRTGLRLAGDLIVYRDQTLSATDVTFDGELATLPIAPEAMLIAPEGQIKARFDSLLWEHERIETLSGIVLWDPARIAAPVRYELGELALKLTGATGKITGQLSSANGPIDAVGTLDLDPQGVLKTDIRLNPKPETPREIRDLLPMLGRSNADGSITMRQTIPLVGLAIHR